MVQSKCHKIYSFSVSVQRKNPDSNVFHAVASGIYLFKVNNGNTGKMCE